MAEKIPLTLDTFFAGDRLALVAVAADIGTDRDRGQFGDTLWTGVDYGRDISLLLDQGFPASSIRREIERSPAVGAIRASVVVEGETLAVSALDATLHYNPEEGTSGLAA